MFSRTFYLAQCLALVNTVNARRGISEGIYRTVELTEYHSRDKDVIGMFAYKGRKDSDGEELSEIQTCGVIEDLKDEESYAAFIRWSCEMEDD